MKTIDINDWVVVNNIIYKLYAADDTAKMCGQFFRNMKMVLDFDCADFYLADSVHLCFIIVISIIPIYTISTALAVI